MPGLHRAPMYGSVVLFAFELQTAAVNARSESTAALLQRAVGLHQQGRYDAAALLYRQVLEREPRQFDALHLSGVMARQRGDAQGAVVLIEQALAVDESSARAHANLSAALADLSDTEAALRSYEQAIALDPRYALAYSNRGNALRALGRLDQAIASYERALAIDPAAFEAACGRAVAFNDQGRHAAALRSAEQALALRPRHVEAWAARGNALHGMGRFSAALECFTHAAGIGGERADLAGWRGGAQFKLGRFEAALASFDASLALRPGHAGVHLRRAHALDALGRREQAIAAFEHALQLGADAGEVRFALAALGAAAAPGAAPAAYVAALFDQYAGHFDAHLVEELAYRTPALIGAALARHGTATQLDTVDLGCGTGLCAAVLRPLSATLTGVDLSAAMLEKAHARGYDALVCADLVAYLMALDDAVDLLVAADVLVYLGDLAPLFAAARRALRRGGRFCFSVELAAGAGFELKASRRYGHADDYIAALAARTGFTVLEATGVVLRRDRGADVDGRIYLLD